MSLPILIVDDTELNCTLLEIYLQEQGYNTVATQSGSEALRLLAERPFSLLILDWLMPEPDGKAVLATVRQQPHLHTMPIVVTSGSSVDVSAEINTGFLPKPFTPENVLSIVQAFLG